MSTTGGVMHVGELDIDAELVRALLAAQFPRWAGLALEPIVPAGTDNAMFKLGDALAVRLPRMERAADSIEQECRWLPRLAPQLPLPVPVPVGQGRPSADYPLPWAVFQLLPGENLSVSRITDLHRAAVDVGEFVRAMQAVEAADGPACARGLPLVTRDAETRAALAELDGVIDTELATRIWQEALATPVWGGRPRWIHGDLHPGNLLAKEGRVSAVIDFGSCGVGDPACDLMIAWTLLDAPSREVFRSIVKPDDAMWARGRGWALTMGIVAYPYYRETNPVFAAVAKQTIGEVCDDEAPGNRRH